LNSPFSNSNFEQTTPITNQVPQQNQTSTIQNDQGFFFKKKIKKYIFKIQMNLFLKSKELYSQFQEAAQYFFSDPNLVNSLIQQYPMLQGLMTPQVRSMLQNPEYIQQITNPETMQVIFFFFP